jgi:hypothetical protein
MVIEKELMCERTCCFSMRSILLILDGVDEGVRARARV